MSTDPGRRADASMAPAAAIYCERCGEQLDEKTAVWLELSCKTNRYARAGTVDASESQGTFSFGRACANTVLRNDGVLAEDRRSLMTYELSRTTRRGGVSTHYGLTKDAVLALLPKIKTPATVRLQGRIVGEVWLERRPRMWLWYLEDSK